MMREVTTILRAKPSRPVRWVAIALVLLVVLSVVLVVLLLWRGTRARQRAVEALPAQTRAALFDETYASARALCSAGPGLREECARRAEFLLEFPECGDVCRAFANAQLRPPTR